MYRSVQIQIPITASPEQQLQSLQPFVRAQLYQQALQQQHNYQQQQPQIKMINSQTIYSNPTNESKPKQAQKTDFTYQKIMKCKVCQNLYDEIIPQVQKKQGSLRSTQSILTRSRQDEALTKHLQSLSISGGQNRRVQPKYGDKRYPLTVNCGHTICSICFQLQLNTQTIFQCKLCDRYLEQQFTSRYPPINKDLYRLRQAIIVKYKEKSALAVLQALGQDDNLVKPEQRCMKRGCMNKRLINSKWQIKWFCTPECMEDYEDGMDQQSKDCISILEGN